MSPLRAVPKVFALCALPLSTLGACAHSPEPTFFALSARQGGVVHAARSLKIELRHTALPGYLDRPHIVRRTTAEQLELDDDELWGAPLAEMVDATLSEDLAQRLPGSTVYQEGGAISAVPDARVEAQLLRFERTASGDVELLAQVAVHAGRAEASIQRFAFTHRPASGRTSDAVRSLSQLLGQLSDGISAMILRQSAVPSGPPSTLDKEIER